ncbi:hypothetical protein PR048_017630 [Dryococelus australis]|uniref:Uncharacterized protein n=1 Tax=Dryococelus australis TaxID=614101 RepID=A0ABQ9HA18_9NEOP|nr:hypothetical protein PR048_017630 [Dryococelus australis]
MDENAASVMSYGAICCYSCLHAKYDQRCACLIFPNKHDSRGFCSRITDFQQRSNRNLTGPFKGNGAPKPKQPSKQWSSAGMKRRGKWEIPEKTCTISGIVRHYSHLRKSGSDPDGDWFFDDVAEQRSRRVQRTCERFRVYFLLPTGSGEGERKYSRNPEQKKKYTMPRLVVIVYLTSSSEWQLATPLSAALFTNCGGSFVLAQCMRRPHLPKPHSGMQFNYGCRVLLTATPQPTMELLVNDGDWARAGLLKRGLQGVLQSAASMISGLIVARCVPGQGSVGIRKACGGEKRLTRSGAVDNSRKLPVGLDDFLTCSRVLHSFKILDLHCRRQSNNEHLFKDETACDCWITWDSLMMSGDANVTWVRGAPLCCCLSERRYNTGRQPACKHRLLVAPHDPLPFLVFKTLCEHACHMRYHRGAPSTFPDRNPMNNYRITKSPYRSVCFEQLPHTKGKRAEHPSIVAQAHLPISARTRTNHERTALSTAQLHTKTRFQNALSQTATEINYPSHRCVSNVVASGSADTIARVCSRSPRLARIDIRDHNSPLEPRWCSGQTTRLPPRRTGFNSRRGGSRIFACGNRAGQCRWSTGFLGDLPFLPTLHSGSAPYSPHFTLIGCQGDILFRSTKTVETRPLALLLGTQEQRQMMHQLHSFPPGTDLQVGRDKSLEIIPSPPFCSKNTYEHRNQPAARTSSSSRTRKRNAGTGQGHVVTPLANQRLETHLPADVDMVSSLSTRRYGFNPRPSDSGFSHVGIVPNDAVGQRVFSVISRFPRPFIPVLLHTHLNNPYRLSPDGSNYQTWYEIWPYKAENVMTGATVDRITAALVDLAPAFTESGIVPGTHGNGKRPASGRAHFSLASCRARPASVCAAHCLSVYHQNWTHRTQPVKLAVCSRPKTLRLARRSDEALGMRVSVALIAPSLLDRRRGVPTGVHLFLLAVISKSQALSLSGCAVAYVLSARTALIDGDKPEAC